MEKINAILKNNRFRRCLDEINKFEEKREFCRHDISHLLDVARITYVIVLERNISEKKEIVYAAALLHDIGRGLQYEKGISHELSSAELAEGILKECGFSERDRNKVIDIILNHRKKDNNNLLNDIFYLSDKLSRNCFICRAAAKCNWPDEKKNSGIEY
ncbi:MAG TPA: hypothetical protein DC034_03905 [Clostridium sp.]|jgi:putative nucleotidyltransferase with HDIG domain|uniref:HD domain-containing protein n=1 Tax=Clostridium lapidicellarium TaxID=3240931 RepID=A0ABV4E1A4_9CLOT|nr:HD domain-containing protein [Clostridiales bacterium]HBC95927.1 hypothetical protein [Clostridium sp.]